MMSILIYFLAAIESFCASFELTLVVAESFIDCCWSILTDWEVDLQACCSRCRSSSQVSTNRSMFDTTLLSICGRVCHQYTSSCKEWTVKEYLLILVFVPENSRYAVIDTDKIVMIPAQETIFRMAMPEVPKVPSNSKNWVILRTLLHLGILSL